MKLNSKLIQKYNIPGPRYTSYPTVPYWDQEIDVDNWKDSVKRSFEESNKTEGISVYIHLPFCESLCTFCACHKRITKRHEVESPYIEAVLKEWKLYVALFDEKPRIAELHLGGGTPTFFSSQNLKRLIDGIFEYAERVEEGSYSFEAHPNATSEEQLKTLFELGFKRNSFGIQDYDSKVQKAIHRIQSFDQVKAIHDASRAVGYESISHDLIFGLPFQTEASIRDTIEKTVKLRPDRIAYYSYAHVPWIKGVGQRGFKDSDLPKDAEKRKLYELGKQLFFEAGYQEIGMDHFALKSDDLYKATKNGGLHRNFMGYSAGKTQMMIGLGASSIGDSWYAFAQNEKSVESYQDIVNNGEFPIYRGHLLTAEDLRIRQHILNLMCDLYTEWKSEDQDEMSDILSRLAELKEDGLIEVGANSIKVKEEGRMFVRNVCMAFDLRLIKNKPETSLFSMTI